MVRAWVAVAIVMISWLILNGCGPGNAGIGGTGELVVPRETLRRIDSAPMAEMGSEMPLPAPEEVPATLPATQPVAESPLTIEAARLAALGNNLQLKVDLINPAIAREAITVQQAAFESVFTTDARFAKQDEPGFAGGDVGQLAGNRSETFALTPGLNVPLRTGGDINLALPFTRFEPNGGDPTYSSDAVFSLSHPLLRNAGTYVNTQPIRAAFYQYQQTEARTKLLVINTLVSVDRAYWRLYAALRLLEVREKEYELALAQLERARRQARVGETAEVETLRAETGVAGAIENIINARNDLADRNRELKRILNIPGLEMGTRTLLIPVSDPKVAAYAVNSDRLINVALQKRMELLESELQIALDTSNVTVARNGLLPLLNFDYQYRVNGFGPAPVETFEVLGDKDFEGHSLGMRLDIPIGNQAARARLRQALASRLQSIATKEQRIELITFEVLNAATELEAAFQRILAARRRVILNARLVEQEVRQFNLGLRTSTEVLEAQTNLVNASLSEIQAITEYQIAQVDIAFATGMILGATNVVWEPATPATR